MSSLHSVLHDTYKYSKHKRERGKTNTIFPSCILFVGNYDFVLYGVVTYKIARGIIKHAEIWFNKSNIIRDLNANLPRFKVAR